MPRILIVDDEQSIIDSLSMVLTSSGYEVDECLNGQCAIEKVIAGDYDLVMLDIKMPKMDGLEVLAKILEINRDLVVIMISGHGTIETAVEATRTGAYDFLQKPLPDLHELKLTVKNAIEYKKSREELKRVRRQIEKDIEIIGSSERIMAVKDLIRKYAPMNQNVLVTGESGTGKELIARQIHIKSSRADHPFITISSANLNEEMIDQELFGKFTGDSFAKGKFEQADGGTIFFDEISTLSKDIQTKLLGVIETNRFVRPGTAKDTYVKVRFVFATNANPEEELQQKNLREDFYHRINVLRIDVAPLRERSEDIPLLTDFFAKRVAEESNTHQKRFTKAALEKMNSFRWPGNARELRNFVERLVISVDKEVIDAEDIEMTGTRHIKEFGELFGKNMSLNEFQNESERIFLLKMLNDYKYNISQTASALQIQRSHLYKLMTKYDIPTPSKIKEG